jgi:hypothetical protein
LQLRTSAFGTLLSLRRLYVCDSNRTIAVIHG